MIIQKDTCTTKTKLGLEGERTNEPSGITCCFADTEFVMLVDNYSEALKLMMTKKQFTQAAFISAYDPYSELLVEPENIKRHDALSKELSDLGLSFLEGLGRDKEGQWPGEKSVLVLNISDASARMLGKKYRQNAILWIEENAIPQLLLLDEKNH